MKTFFPKNRLSWFQLLQLQVIVNMFILLHFYWILKMATCCFTFHLLCFRIRCYVLHPWACKLVQWIFSMKPFLISLNQLLWVILGICSPLMKLIVDRDGSCNAANTVTIIVLAPIIRKYEIYTFPQMRIFTLMWL